MGIIDKHLSEMMYVSNVRASATETDVTGAAALARGGWLAKCYVPTYGTKKGSKHP